MTRLKTHIAMQEVSSSNITSLGYDTQSETMAVLFKNNTLYNYERVPHEVFDTIKSAESVGKTFITLVKSQPHAYPYTRITSTPTS